MYRSRILVVEDEAIVATQIMKKLNRIGYRVVGKVSSGEKAIKEVGNKMPDLVLMDIKLEGTMDGVETAEYLHSKFDIPVVYLTAHSDDKIIDRAKTTEPLGYIVKPFEDGDLRSTIEIALYKEKINQKLVLSLFTPHNINII